jgi:predicted RND superfamily exporter protein
VHIRASNGKEKIVSRFETAFGKWVISYRWWIIAATIIAVFAAAGGTQFLTFSNDNRVFFSKDNPQLQALDALENTYDKTNNVLFVVAPKGGEVFSRESLTAVSRLTEAAWQLPYSSRVNSITNFQHTRAEEDDLIVEDLVPSVDGLSKDDLRQIKEIATSEPRLVNSLISPSGHVTGIMINFLLPGKSMMEVSEIAGASRALADEIRGDYPEIDLYLTGSVMSDNAFGEAGMKDMSTLVPLMFLVMVIIAGIALRSVSGTIGTLIILLFSMVTGMGLAGWLRIPITAASSNAPTIIIMLAVADSIHILATIFQQMRRGKTKRDAIAESIRINLQPVFLTSITTAIGFLTMNFSDAPPFRDLGNMVAMGIMGAFVYSVFFLPSLMAVLPVRISAKNESSRLCCGRLADLVVNHRKLIFVGMSALIFLMTVGTTKIEFQDDWMKYFDKSFDIRIATDFTEANLTGFNSIEYSLDSDEEGGINDPAYLAKVEQFADWYRSQPKVVNVNSITNTMKRLNQDMHGGDNSYYRIPDQRDLAAQYLLLYEMSLPFGLDLNNQINVDKSATRMIVTLSGATTRDLLEIEEEAKAWLRSNAPEMYTYGSGLSMMFAHISRRNIESMLGASLMALVLISLILIFALRSFKLGLLSLIPNLAPAFAAFGLWGFFVGQAGLGLSVIVAMTLGIVVDDTVHFMSKYLRHRREHNQDPAAAVRSSFDSVGTAMWVTTIALVAGFMVLTLSGYKMNSDLGWLSAITINLALAFDFLLLPALLLLVDRRTVEEDIYQKEMSDEVEYRNLGSITGAIAGAVTVPVDNRRDSSDA